MNYRMKAPTRIEFEVHSLYETLLTVKDKRKARGKRYEVATILTLRVLAKVGGEDPPRRDGGVGETADGDVTRESRDQEVDHAPCGDLSAGVRNGGEYRGVRAGSRGVFQTVCQG